MIPAGGVKVEAEEKAAPRVDVFVLLLLMSCCQEVCGYWLVLALQLAHHTIFLFHCLPP